MSTTWIREAREQMRAFFATASREDLEEALLFGEVDHYREMTEEVILMQRVLLLEVNPSTLELQPTSPVAPAEPPPLWSAEAEWQAWGEVVDTSSPLCLTAANDYSYALAV